MNPDPIHILLMALAVGLVVLWLKELLARRKLQSRVSVLEAELEPLRKYSKIIDVEAEISDLREIAESDINRITTAAKDTKAEAEGALEKARTVLQDAQSSAKALREEVLAGARSEAEEIAGEALSVKAKAEEFQAMYEAMRNAVEGIGDEYIIPNHTAIDDLADEFDHKEAGQELKNCRNETKAAVVAHKAADCDYSERRRRQTAIHFVVDAFNGKVDSTLPKAKKGNFGKLKQEIEDAFAIVNRHGQAFRNARITDTYKQLRLNELKWVVATEELKQLEREEQRAIKAQIREEERARREYEKAKREAEKEERMLEQAMEKARAEMAKASAEERSKYELELAELEAKWQAAEEKNQRAISMAQQTKRGHVYIISNIGSFGHDVYKVGMTRRLEPMDRVKELGDASVPFNFDVHAMIFSDDAPKLEHELHQKFEGNRLNKINLRREFFKVTLRELKETVEQLGIEVHWTLFAEAAQYRESLAMDQEVDDVAHA